MDAHLANPAVPAHRLNHRPAFGDTERKRLLDIHVLARLAGLNRLQRVPVVGRGDDHRVHLFHREQPPVILELPG